MNHAERVKSLSLAWVSAAELAYSHLAGRIEQLASDEAQAELYDAIDAMQAEIDSLRKDAERAHRYERLLIGCRSAMRAAGQRANYATDWQHMIASIDAALSEEVKGGA